MDGPFHVWVCSDVPPSVSGALVPALWSTKDGYSTIAICYCHFLKIIVLDGKKCDAKSYICINICMYVCIKINWLIDPEWVCMCVYTHTENSQWYFYHFVLGCMYIQTHGLGSYCRFVVAICFCKSLHVCTKAHVWPLWVTADKGQPKIILSSKGRRWKTSLATTGLHNVVHISTYVLLAWPAVALKLSTNV